MSRENGASSHNFGKLPDSCKKMTGCPFVMLSTDNTLTEWYRREKMGASRGLVTSLSIMSICNTQEKQGRSSLPPLPQQALLSYPLQSSLPSPFELFSAVAILGWCRPFSAHPRQTKILLPLTWLQQHQGWCPESVLCYCDTAIIFLHSSKTKQ